MLDQIFEDADRQIKEATLQLATPIGSYFDWCGNFLDCGPGNCIFTEELVQRLGGPNAFVADYNERRRKIAVDKGWTARYSDCNEHIAYPDSYFDAIHAGQIIEHLCDTDTFVRELYRVLKPGGYCLISTPNLASWHNIVTLMLGQQPHVAMVSDEIVRWKLADEEVDEPKHRRIFTGPGLRMLLEHHGFMVEIIRGAGYYPFPGAMGQLMGRLDAAHCAYIVAKARKGKIITDELPVSVEARKKGGCWQRGKVGRDI